MKLSRIISGLAVGAVLVSTASDVQAQNRRTSGVSSLGEMGCREVRGAKGYSPLNNDIVLGREVLRAIAALGGTNQFFHRYLGISQQEQTEVVCRLASPNETPRFRTLVLSFGLPENSVVKVDGSVNVRLSIYKDGNFYGAQTVSKGDKLRWPIDVVNTRSLALEAECVRTAQGESTCPPLIFFEDILRK